MKRFFLVGTLSNRHSQNTLSVAANNFQWNCLDVFKIEDVISINAREEVSDSSLTVFSLNTKNKVRFFKVSAAQFIKLSKYNSPLFYNIEWYTIHLLLLALLLRRNPRVIALDLSINRYFYKALLFLSRNPIVLRTSFLLTDKQNHVLFPGFISKLVPKEDYSTTSNKPLRSILCGSLGPNTGLSEFCELAEKNSDMEFHVSGVPHRIQESDVIATIDRFNTNRNIIYHGSLSWDSYVDLLRSCDFGFSLRSADEENKYNFPSKLLEYITMGLIPVSSIVYAEYTDLRIFSVEDLPLLQLNSRPKRVEIIKHNQRVLSNYNKVERFF
jgi:hypothetical protein